MKHGYKVKVNNTFDFDIDAEQLKSLDIAKTRESMYHILESNQPYHAEVVSSDFNTKTYTIKINNKPYTVKISNALDLLIKDMGFEIGSAKIVNEIKAPMPGLILDIIVKPGQEVKENDALLILEAMKMENVLTAPRDGVIKSISANTGDAVEKNQLLIEFE